MALHGAEIVYMDKEPTLENSSTMTITKAQVGQRTCNIICPSHLTPTLLFITYKIRLLLQVLLIVKILMEIPLDLQFM